MKINYDVKKAQINAQNKKIKRDRILAYLLLAFFVFWSVGSVLGIFAFTKSTSSEIIGASADGYEVIDDNVTRIQYGMNPLNPANFDWTGFVDRDNKPYLTAVQNAKGGWTLSGVSSADADKWVTVYNFTFPTLNTSDSVQADIYNNWRFDFYSWYYPNGDGYPFDVRFVASLGGEPYIISSTTQNNITMLPPLSVMSSYEIQIYYNSIQFEGVEWYPNIVEGAYFGESFRPYLPIVNDDGAYSDGYDDGYAYGYYDGQIDGIDIGYDNGYKVGQRDGYNIGYTDGDRDGQVTGYNRGYTAGYDVGENVGYNSGFQEGIESANDYSFYGLLTAVVDAPVRAFTGLFNFEILGVNMLDLFTGLFTLCVVLAIVKFIL